MARKLRRNAPGLVDAVAEPVRISGRGRLDVRSGDREREDAAEALVPGVVSAQRGCFQAPKQNQRMPEPSLPVLSEATPGSASATAARQASAPSAEYEGTTCCV